MNRREFLRRAVMGSMFVVIGAVGVLEFVEKLGSSQSATTLTTLQTSQTGTASLAAPQGYLYVGKVTDLGGATSAYFTHPNYGNSILLLLGGQWKAFTATCTHQVCTVQYTNSQIYCPCHGGTFDPSNGAVTSGPPPSPLTEFTILVQSGAIYVSQNAL
jgi:Rieske Fe-S protein